MNILLSIIIITISAILRVGLYPNYPFHFEILTVISGILTPLVIFYLFKDKKLSTIFSLIVATNPLNIFFSRGDFPLTTVLFFLLILILLLIKKYYIQCLFIVPITLYFGIKFIETIDFSPSFESIIHYFNYLSPKFLMISGDWQHPINTVPYLGALLYPTYFFFIYGVYKKINKYFLGWLLLYPVFPAITANSINSYLALPLSIPILFFAAQGIDALIKKSRFITLGLVIIYCLSLYYFFDLYFIHLIKINPTLFSYLVNCVRQIS